MHGNTAQVTAQSRGTNIVVLSLFLKIDVAAVFEKVFLFFFFFPFSNGESSSMHDQLLCRRNGPYGFCATNRPCNGHGRRSRRGQKRNESLTLVSWFDDSLLLPTRFGAAVVSPIFMCPSFYAAVPSFGEYTSQLIFRYPLQLLMYASVIKLSSHPRCCRLSGLNISLAVMCFSRCVTIRRTLIKKGTDSPPDAADLLPTVG